ncbi:aminopeptidase [candidate division WOR-3 bacterium]|uniref:Aminopeptidase n=1 Tax=candidate division WOR-3 bacterium TaxID=2052148 RepID=A0A9D5K9D4_UNCW3|nr:aminopeptidase [candidate division WOR-3 bacterium]MBD3364535.1 aminopeptidase [candidate division WOR-3 bacterium]
MTGYLKGIRNIVDSCLGVKKGDRSVVICDRPKRKIGADLFDYLVKTGADATLCEIIPRRQHGEEPPKYVAELLRQTDVFLIPASKSMTHTHARKQAIEKGARGATLPDVTEDMISRTMAADYKGIEKRTRKLAKIMAGAKRVHITTASGTDVEIVTEGREFFLDTGVLTKPGAFSNLPAGEIYIAPLEGKSNGIVVFDASFSGIGMLSQPITIEIENGRAARIKGDRGKLARMLDAPGKKGRNLAELGIGTNDRAKITGNVLEDEKVMGTIHLAFGDNSTFGGKVKVDVHLDGMVLKPNVVADGREIMKNGRHML